ncbi:MAG: hypothetical protein WC681_14290 [Sterolibacterium sp.]|jgi:hypothetical protein
MHELDEYSLKAILEWLDEHEKYAMPLRNRSDGDPCHALAVSILGCAVEMRAALAQYEELGHRELLMESMNDWKKAHPGHHEPPQDVWRALNTEAGKRAFRERCPHLAQLASAIAEMRTDAESTFKC